ncbi:TraI domain-containing protein [Klebsiella oxytoca]|uniref:TraI domain-containing protein n=1 Tax=Klebsiella oxytoca TaxID=571 RepID=A0AAP2FJM9_KLEOX|nr:MobH family relaxase [Klebsiella oxytoca]MBQ0600835.1 TraI domain-containing protein [Klebsiella oxytoca]
MFKIIQRLFFGKKEKQPTGVQIIMPQEVVEALSSSREILQYPPAENGFPAKIPGYALLSLQEEIIIKIKRELMIRDSEFEEFIQPMFNNFANFVHLLPASQSHHHRAQGGLLRHTLEVILYSIKIAKSFEFDANESPVIKSDRALAWRIAVVVGAVMHDIGKPISDVDVWDKSGEHHWSPTVNCIHEWAEQKDIERFYIYWRSDRHERHHNTSLTKMTDIVPKTLLAFLMEEGNDIYNELTEALAGSNSFRATATRIETGTAYKNKIHKIVSTADSRSVKEDLKRYSGDAVRAAQTGVSVVARIVDAIRLLVKRGDWVPNKPGSPIWYTTEGLFVVWGSAVEPITTIVKSSGVNVPHSADSLADIMLSYGLFVLNENDSVYWRMAPHILNDKKSRQDKEPKNALSCIKFVDPIVIFIEDVVPNPTSCRIKLADGWREFLAAGGKSTLRESRAYIGDKPEEKILPLNVDPEILKGGSLPPTEDLPPDGTVVKRGTVVEPKNIVDHMLRINLLSPEVAAAIKKRDAENLKAKETAANPSAQQAETTDKRFSEKDNHPENTSDKKASNNQNPVDTKSHDKPAETQGQLFAEEYASHPYIDADSDDDTADIVHEYQMQDNEQSTITLRERMDQAAIQQKYKDDEAHIQQDSAKPAVDLWAEAQQRIRQSKDEAYEQTTQPYANKHEISELKDIPGVLERGHIFSSLFKDAPEATKLILKKIINERPKELIADNYHLFIHKKDEQDEENYSAMVAAGWVWKPFLDPNEKFHMYKSKPGYFLKRGLNDDINYLSGGNYLKNILPVNPNDVYCPENDLYRAIASYGQLKKTFDNKDVIALSGSAIRNMAKSLELDTTSVRFLVCFNFDSVNKRGSEHVLVDENIRPYMVDSHE